jgi:DNA topoisomerase-1
VQLYGKAGLADEPRGLQDQVEERPGSARGHPPDLGREYRAGDIENFSRRSVPAVFADLEAHRGLPDGAAVFDTVAVDMLAGADGPKRTVLRANGSTLVKPGYISVYQEGMDDVVQDDSDHVLPPMKEGDRSSCSASCRAAFHRAAAALLRSLAGQGAGRVRHRPALDLCLHHFHLRDREYVEIEKPALHGDRHRQDRQPLPDAVLHHLRGLRLHRQDGRLLDAVANGEQEWVPLLEKFWKPFIDLVEAHRDLGEPRGSGAGARPGRIR